MYHTWKYGPGLQFINKIHHFSLALKQRSSPNLKLSRLQHVTRKEVQFVFKAKWMLHHVCIPYIFKPLCSPRRLLLTICCSEEYIRPRQKGFANKQSDAHKLGVTERLKGLWEMPRVRCAVLTAGDVVAAGDGRRRHYWCISTTDRRRLFLNGIRTLWRASTPCWICFFPVFSFVLFCFSSPLPPPCVNVRVLTIPDFWFGAKFWDAG